MQTHQQRLDTAADLATVLNHRLPHHFVWGLGDEDAALLELCDWLGYRVLPADPAPRVVSWPA